MKLNIEERQYQIDDVDYQTGRVSLRDITFQNGAGFPIFRSESTEFVRSFVEEQQWDNLELEPVQEPAEPQTETVAVYPGEKNQLPYAIVVEKIRVG